jgi:hypothetical protein
VPEQFTGLFQIVQLFKEQAMRKTLAVAAALSAFSLPAVAQVSASYATDALQVATTIALKDGSSVTVYKDGKMAMEDRFGRSISMKPGQAMEARDGSKLVMTGNETYRVEWRDPTLRTRTD